MTTTQHPGVVVTSDDEADLPQPAPSEAAITATLGKTANSEHQPAEDTPTEEEASSTTTDDDDDDAISKGGGILIPAHSLQQWQRLDFQRRVLQQQYLRERTELEARYQREVHALYRQRPVVPAVWAGAMARHNRISLTDADQQMLYTCLQDVRCTDRVDGFQLTFHFGANPYFTNSVLQKDYTVPNLLLQGEPVLQQVTGDKIDWKEGMALTYRMVTKKQRGKGKRAGQLRIVQKREPTDSFFHWFSPPTLPTSMEDVDEEEAEQLEATFDDDYEVAEAFRTEIIPETIKWFLGEEGEDNRVNELPEKETNDMKKP